MTQLPLSQIAQIATTLGVPLTLHSTEGTVTGMVMANGPAGIMLEGSTTVYKPEQFDSFSLPAAKGSVS